MSELPWRDLMLLGIRDLGLSPDDFWSLTPGELMLLAGSGESSGAVTSSGLSRLMSMFPDKESI